MNKTDIIKRLSEVPQMVDDLDLYMNVIKGLIDEDIKLEHTEIGQMKFFVNELYLLVKEVEQYND